MNIKQLLGRNVRKHRENLKWSQEELAECAELHRTYISGIERGVRNPTVSIVAQVAAALGVDPSDLLKGNDTG